MVGRERTSPVHEGTYGVVARSLPSGSEAEGALPLLCTDVETVT